MTYMTKKDKLEMKAFLVNISPKSLDLSLFIVNEHDNHYFRIKALRCWRYANILYIYVDKILSYKAYTYMDGMNRIYTLAEHTTR